MPLTASREEFEKDRSKRLRKMKALLKTRQDLGDHALAHIHEIGAELPEECLIALTDELPVHLSCLYADYMNAEYFLEKTKGEPVVKAYKWYKQVLQLLSYQVAEETDPKRWLLKCPIHIFYFKELAKAFPDAKVVWYVKDYDYSM